VLFSQGPETELSKEKQFWDAADKGDLSVVKNLAADPTLKINWQDSQFADTALNIACYQGREFVVEFLLTLPNIDVNKPNKDEATPFYIACQIGDKEVVSPLLSHPRIDVNKPKNTGSSPFFIACENGHKEVVSLLMADKRIDVNKPKNTGSSPFLIACGKGHRCNSCS